EVGRDEVMVGFEVAPRPEVCSSALLIDCASYGVGKGAWRRVPGRRTMNRVDVEHPGVDVRQESEVDELSEQLQTLVGVRIEVGTAVTPASHESPVLQLDECLSTMTLISTFVHQSAPADPICEPDLSGPVPIADSSDQRGSGRTGGAAHQQGQEVHHRRLGREGMIGGTAVSKLL